MRAKVDDKRGRHGISLQGCRHELHNHTGKRGIWQSLGTDKQQSDDLIDVRLTLATSQAQKSSTSCIYTPLI